MDTKETMNRLDDDGMALLKKCWLLLSILRDEYHLEDRVDGTIAEMRTYVEAHHYPTPVGVPNAHTCH